MVRYGVTTVKPTNILRTLNDKIICNYCKKEYQAKDIMRVRIDDSLACRKCYQRLNEGFLN